MSNFKRKFSNRLLAAILSLVMVFSMFPITGLTALAATAEHPNAVTITVVDNDGLPVKNATVAYTINSVLNGEAFITDSKTTDENGVVEVLPSSDFVADDLTINATITAAGHENGEITDQPISAADQDIQATIVSKIIKDVTISWQDNLKYTGSPLTLVSVSSIEGDTVEYEIDGQPVVKPEQTYAGTYTVKVTVTRNGKEPLTESKDITIAPKALEIGLTANAALTYNKEEQALVSVPTGIAIGDKVSWTVGEKAPVSYTVDETNIDYVPVEKNVGEYKIKLTVERNDNYTVFNSEELTAKISATAIDGLGAQLATGLVYNGNDQELVKKDDATGKYVVGLEDGDIVYYIVGTNASNVAASNAWVEWTDTSLPIGNDAGDYTVRIKVVRTNYNDTEVELDPATVTIAKASQSLEFINKVPTEVIIDKDNTANNIYDFTARGENLSGNDIVYSLVNASNPEVASIEAGLVTVKKAGMVTIKASRTGNSNYEDVEIYMTLTVSEASDLIDFTESVVKYTLDEDGIASKQAVNVKNNDDYGAITYSIDKTNIGLSIDASSGTVTITDWNKLRKEMKNDGSTSVVVKVNKAAGTVTELEWSWSQFKFIEVTKEIYKAAEASYTLLINYDAAPAFDTVCNITEPSTTGWYNSSNPAVITPIDGAVYSVALDTTDRNAFGSSVTVTDQGTDTHYIFLKNLKSKKISAGIPINIKVDTEILAANEMRIDYNASIIDQILEAITFGSYKYPVTVKFSAEDTNSGIDYFSWQYEKNGNWVEESDNKDVVVSADGKTSEIVLPDSAITDYKGKIRFTVTDKAGNTSDWKEDNHTIVIDSIAPNCTVSYADPENTIGANRYFNADVELTFNVTEANFYSEDMHVYVATLTKDGTEIARNEVSDEINWNGNVGTYKISGDGHYVVYANYKDRSYNEGLFSDKYDTEKATEYVSDTLTIDKTHPVVEIKYVHDGDIQKTIFTVTEHNFRASDVIITGTMKDITNADIAFTAKQLTTMLQNAQWTQDGDVYTYEYDKYIDGIYNLNMDYKDISNWEATQFDAKEFKIDHNGPTDIKVEYAKSPLDTFLEVITLGFYNPYVTVRFTATDVTTGVKDFTWNYTKQTGASDINRPTDTIPTVVSAVQDSADASKFTATVTLPDNEFKQLRGYLAVFATDNYNNDSAKVTDEGNIVVVDSIGPKVKIEYSEADRVVGTTSYYKDVTDVTITVEEANFYAEDVNVTVSKDGGAEYEVTPDWKDVDVNNHIGTFTLSGDGDYIVYVTYKDHSDNVMEMDGGKVEKYQSDVKTIDTIAPVIDVKYNDDKFIETLKDGDGHDRDYFDGTRTAEVTITEHNFDENEVKFSIIAKDVTGKVLDANALNEKTAWKNNGDIHTITITYPGDANYTFDVDYTDLATNEAADYTPDYFTVDNTAPTNLTVSYSTSVLDTVLESLTFGFYNAKMTVTITADDITSGVHSFVYSYLNADGVSSVNADLVKQLIEAADIKYSEDGKTATATFEIPKMVLGNDNQFNGTVEFTANDRAKNETELKDSKRIVVDNIAPTAQVSYNEATNVVGDISYYNGNINATVTINEANFYANDVQVSVTKDGATYTVSPSWTNNSVDTHTGTFTLTEDGDYVITISYKDKSSNEMTTYTSEQLTIDTKIDEPIITINGKDENGKAYKDEIVPAVNFEDQNFENYEITLTRTRFGDKNVDVKAKFIGEHVALNDKGGSGTFDEFEKIAENDGIYTLTVKMSDKAGHESEKTVTFTVNRFGSVYEYSDYLVSLIENGGAYVGSISNDLVITEYNADRLVGESLNIVITRDGKPLDEVKYNVSPVINDQVSVGDSGWFQYEYTISKDNFSADGVYKISVSSKDATGNVPENTNYEDKNILFRVDSTAPEITSIVGLEKDIINAQEVTVKYTVYDTIGLKSIKVFVNDKLVGEEITDFTADLNNYNGSFVLNESSDAQKVRIEVEDLAGNITNTDSEDFSSEYVFNKTVTVSTNFFVRWYANKPLFWGSIGGVVVLTGLLWFLIAFKRKKKDEEETK